MFFYIGWKIRRSKEKNEEFESTAEERSVTTERTAGVTGPGAGATRGERHRAGAEDAEYKSGSDAEKGERFLLEREYKWRHFSLT